MTLYQIFKLLWFAERNCCQGENGAVFHICTGIQLVVVRAPPTNVGGALLFSACPSFCPYVRSHSNSVIFYRISFKLHIWIAFSNLSFKFEYGFCLTSGNQNGRHLSISAVVVTLIQSFLIRFLPSFICELFINLSFKSLNTSFV